MGKGRGEGDTERFYTASEIEELLPQLSRQNARGYDVYITPISDDEHYLVLDDSTKEQVRELWREGYRPALVQESSPGNVQAIFRAPKAEVSKSEQSRANRIVSALNQAHGDPAFSGVIHPFRLAGFSNAKQKYEDEKTGYRPLVRVHYAGPQQCPVCGQKLQEERQREKIERWRQKKKQEAAERERQVQEQAERERAQAQEQQVARPVAGDAAADWSRAYKRHYGLAQKMVQAGRWRETNYSALDYRATCDALKAGHSPEEVARALIACSPELSERHHDVHDYARRTVVAAQAERERDLGAEQYSGPDFGMM